MPERVLRRREVEEVTGISCSQIYKLMSERAFPLPIRLSANAVGWRYTAIREWIETRPTVRNAAELTNNQPQQSNW
ncbi:MAG: AlpA family phage regulatory protein [Alphaproteobacteria bacterium]|nr:AlpA family phage regulatory protein [Alphaproteobacteria bacterium]